MKTANRERRPRFNGRLFRMDLSRMSKKKIDKIFSLRSQTGYNETQEFRNHS